MSSKARTTDKRESVVLTPAQAVERYERLVKESPTVANYLELGAAYYIAHRWQDALAAFEKTVELDPSQAVAYYYLGVLYAALGKPDLASAALKNVLEHSPNQMLKEQAKARIPAVKGLADLGVKE